MRTNTLKKLKVVNANQILKNGRMVSENNLMASFSLTVLNKNDYTEKEISILKPLLQEDENGIILFAPGKLLIFPFEEYLYFLCERIKKTIDLGINKILIKDINIPYFSNNQQRYQKLWINEYDMKYDNSNIDMSFIEKDYKIKIQILINALKYILFFIKGYVSIQNQNISVCLELYDVFECRKNEVYAPFADMLKEIPYDDIILISKTDDSNELPIKKIAKKILIKSIYNSYISSQSNNKYELITDLLINNDYYADIEKSNENNNPIIIIPQNLPMLFCCEKLLDRQDKISEIEEIIINLISFFLSNEIIPTIIYENNLDKLSYLTSKIIIINNLSNEYSYYLFCQISKYKNKPQIIIVKDKNNKYDNDHLLSSQTLSFDKINESFGNKDTTYNKLITYYNFKSKKANGIIDIMKSNYRIICNFSDSEKNISGLFADIYSEKYTICNKISIKSNECSIYKDIEMRNNDDPFIVASNCIINDFCNNGSIVTFSIENHKKNIAKCRIFIPFTCAIYVNNQKIEFETDDFKQTIYFEIDNESINQVKIIRIL